MYLLDSIVPGRTSARKTALQLAAACIALLEIDKDVEDGAVTYQFLVQAFAEEYCRSTKLPVTKIDAYRDDIRKLVRNGKKPSRCRWDFRVRAAVDRCYLERTQGIPLETRLEAMMVELVEFVKAADKAQGHEAEELRFGMGFDL